MDRYVWAMGLARLIFSVLNLAAALLIWKMNSAANALKINAVFGSFIGPFTFILVSGLGMAGLAKVLNPTKLALLIGGVVLILLGSRQ